MKPNLFSIATKELSQDAFITWLLQWADDKYLNENKVLCQIGKNFVNKLISLQYPQLNIDVKVVNAGRQWEHIDIWAEINDDYLIIIEDKVNTNQHDNQLEIYKKTANEYYKNSRKIIFIYLKTGNDSLNTINQIKELGWYYFSRKQFIDFLQKIKTESEIYNDFLNNLQTIQSKFESFIEYKNIFNPEATQGLFSYLENNIIEDWSDWGYVSNQTGGFHGFWSNFIPFTSNNEIELYLQIENYTYLNDIKLFIKIKGPWTGGIDYLYFLLKKIIQKGKEYNLTIKKPARYRIGSFTSVAIIDNVFLQEKNGKLDLINLENKFNSAIDLIYSVTKDL